MPRALPDGFKSKNQTVEKAFYLVINSVYRNPRKVYKYCYKEMNHNIINLQKHLNKYRLYRDGKASDEPIDGSQQTFLDLITAMSQIKVDYWKRAKMTIC